MSRYPQPQNKATRICRYLTVPKWKQLLERQALCLSRLDMFSRADPFEGSLPRLALERLEGDQPEHLRESETAERRFAWSRQFYVSCWFNSVHENDGMWRLYGGGENGGVCIYSTYYQLQHAIKDFDVGMGLVSYIDYQKDDFIWDDDRAPMMHKRMEFSHEREVRLVLVKACRFFLLSTEEAMAELENRPERYWLPISLEACVNKVLVSPYASREVRREITEEAQNRLPGLVPKITSSAMLEKPSWGRNHPFVDSPEKS